MTTLGEVLFASSFLAIIENDILLWQVFFAPKWPFGENFISILIPLRCYSAANDACIPAESLAVSNDLKHFCNWKTMCC